MVQPFSDVTWCGWPACARSASTCPARFMLKATTSVVALPCVALQLSSFDAAAAPPHLMHRQEAAGGLVDVHDAVCADAAGAHQPAQLDEEPVRVGVLLSRVVEPFHALGGFLATKAHAVQELSNHSRPERTSSPSVSSHSCTRLLNRHRAEAQDDGDPHDVLAEPCHVSCVRVRGKIFLPSGAAGDALRFQR